MLIKHPADANHITKKWFKWHQNTMTPYLAHQTLFKETPNIQKDNFPSIKLKPELKQSPKVHRETYNIWSFFPV